MKTYETTFIINPQTDDATIEKHVKDVASIITARNGKILHQNQMGTRRLAYEIQGLTQGYYANFLYEAPNEVLPALEKHFRTNEMYIRNLTVRFEADVERYLKYQNVSFSSHHHDADEQEGPGRSSERREHASDRRPVAVDKKVDEEAGDTGDDDQDQE